MPSCWATRRASSTSDTEQQPESDGPPQSLSVAPTTSCPDSTSNAAATDESTPPDMATSTRTIAVCHPASGRRPERLAAQARHRGGNGLERRGDIVFGGRMPQGEPHGAAGLRTSHPHGQQHVTRLDGTAGTGRTGRRADPRLIQEHEKLLLLDAVESEVAVTREHVLAGRALDGAGDGG